MVAPLSEVLQEGSSLFSLSLIKLHLASYPLASSYSRVTVSLLFCAQNVFFSAQVCGAPLRNQVDLTDSKEGSPLLVALSAFLQIFDPNLLLLLLHVLYSSCFYITCISITHAIAKYFTPASITVYQSLWPVVI